MIKIFIDDVRDPSFIGWDISECKVFRTSNEAITFLLPVLQDADQNIKISFDHDLGFADDTTFIASLLEEAAFKGKIKCKISWLIHSMNPVGAKNLKSILEAMDRYIARSRS